MNKKKVLTLGLSLGLVGAVAVGSSLAYFTDKDEAQNTFTMGHVDIELEEPKWDLEHPDGAITNVVPNQVITKDPTITLAEGSESAYIRANVEIVGLDEEKEADLLAAVKAAVEEEVWTFGNDGKFYLNYEVDKENAGQKLVLFDHIVIPAAWGNEIADKTFEINVTAEAIQADNFIPDRDDSGHIVGWGDVTIEQYTVK